MQRAGFSKREIQMLVWKNKFGMQKARINPKSARVLYGGKDQIGLF